MKRCPLCDFIYEDDQSLCDLDGMALVDDRGALPAPAQAAARGPVTAAKSPRGKFLVLPLVGVVLGAAAFSVYHVSTGGAASANNDHSSASVAGRPAAAPPQSVAAPLAPTPIPSPDGSPANDVEGADTAAPVTRPSPAPSRPRATRLNERGRRPESGNSKKESKLKSFVNKTGRILKKPFKF